MYVTNIGQSPQNRMSGSAVNAGCILCKVLLDLLDTVLYIYSRTRVSWNGTAENTSQKLTSNHVFDRSTQLYCVYQFIHWNVYLQYFKRCIFEVNHTLYIPCFSILSMSDHACVYKVSCRPGQVIQDGGMLFLGHYIRMLLMQSSVCIWAHPGSYPDPGQIVPSIFQRWRTASIQKVYIFAISIPFIAIYWANVQWELMGGWLWNSQHAWIWSRNQRKHGRTMRWEKTLNASA